MLPGSGRRIDSQMSEPIYAGAAEPQRILRHLQNPLMQQRLVRRHADLSGKMVVANSSLA
jgi:hypothetical protein